MNLSVIVASGGRASLQWTLQSINSQLDVRDECLTIVDQRAPWGHATRNRAMPQASGDMLCFMDDDDAYVPGAFQVMRSAAGAAPESMHIFRMRYADGRELWIDREVRLGNVSTQMVVVPNRPPYARWAEELYEGDYHFIRACAERFPVVWHEDVIALIRPGGG